MRKFVLFVLAIGFAFSSIAQNQMVKKKDVKRVADGQEVAISQTIPTPQLNLKATNENVSRIEVGTSAHQRPFRREEGRIVAYNPDMDIISVTYILDPETYPEASEVGIVGQFYSTDHGQTWNGPIVIADDLSNGPNYYTTGSMYNPEGNSNIDEVQAVYQGTIFPTTGDWRFSMYGNNYYDGSSLMNYSFESTDPGYGYYGYWNIFGLQQIGDEMRCMNLYTFGDWSAFSEISIESIRATYDGGEFDWENTEQVEVDFLLDEEGVVQWNGMYVSNDAGAEIAWSNDGEIGYAWMLGTHADDLSAWQPIVFRTEDGGDSWDYIFLDFQEEDNQAILYPHLINAGGTEIVIPMFNESVGTVNAAGDLEMIAKVGSASADIFTYPDSLGWTWSYPGDLFNITVNADGVSNLIWVDSLNTSNVAQDSEGNYCGTEGWQHRLYATKSADEEQIMFTWTDTRDTEANELNLQPDLFGWAKNSYTSMEEEICFTEGTLYETFYYFTCGSDFAIDMGDNFTVPYVQAVSPGEFSSNSSTSADPVTVSYVTGIEFPKLPVGVNEISNGYSSIKVAQNQPNPFTGTTTIEISSNTVAPVMLEVSNIMGQTIYTMNAGTINGSKRVELNASDLESGVYFYTVTIGNESVSKKMVIE